MYTLRFRNKDNTFQERDISPRWLTADQELRDVLAADESCYRKYLTLRLPKGWRISLVRIR